MDDGACSVTDVSFYFLVGEPGGQTSWSVAEDILLAMINLLRPIGEYSPVQDRALSEPVPHYH